MELWVRKKGLAGNKTKKAGRNKEKDSQRIL